MFFDVALLADNLQVLQAIVCWKPLPTQIPSPMVFVMNVLCGNPTAGTASFSQPQRLFAKTIEVQLFPGLFLVSTSFLWRHGVVPSLGLGPKGIRVIGIVLLVVRPDTFFTPSITCFDSIPVPTLPFTHVLRTNFSAHSYLLLAVISIDELDHKGKPQDEDKVHAPGDRGLTCYNGKAILHYWNDLLQKFFQEGTLGKRRLKKLLSVFADSNVFPSAKDPTAWALHDRFLFRNYEGDLKNVESFKTMLRDRAVLGKVRPFTQEEAPLSVTDLLAGAAEIKTVDVPETVIETMAKIRSEGQLSGVHLSPRRWAESMDAIKYQAWYEGRDHAEPSDTVILATVLWNMPADIPKMLSILAKYGSPVVFKMKDAREISEDAYNGVMAIIGADANNTQAIAQAGRGARKKLQEQKTELTRLRADHPDEGMKIDELVSQVDTWLADLVDKCF